MSRKDAYCQHHLSSNALPMKEVPYLNCPLNMDFIRRHESRQGYEMKDFTETDWKLVRAVSKMKWKEREIMEERESKKIVILPPHQHFETTDTNKGSAKTRTKRCAKIRKANPTLITCPFIIKRTNAPCGNHVKEGEYICGKHKKPTNVPYVVHAS